MTIVLALDLLSIGLALTSARLWYRASRTRVRRIGRLEVLDAADVNRIVVALNRTQMLNARAALATVGAAVAAGVRFGLDLSAAG